MYSSRNWTSEVTTYGGIEMGILLLLIIIITKFIKFIIINNNANDPYELWKKIL